MACSKASSGRLVLQRESGEDVQTNVLRVLLGQAAQAFTLFLGQHGPFHALGHLGLVGTTVGVRVLRGEAHRAVGVTARAPHVFRALLLTVLALLFLRKLAEFAVTTVVVAAIVTAEVTTIIAAVVPAEVAAVAITAIVVATEVATLTIAAEITTIVIPCGHRDGSHDGHCHAEVTTVPIATVSLGNLGGRRCGGSCDAHHRGGNHDDRYHGAGSADSRRSRLRGNGSRLRGAA